MTFTIVIAFGACGSHPGSSPASPSPRVVSPRECPPGRADCDGDPANGCEIDTTSDMDNCHVCGMSCRAPHTTAGCFDGVCHIIACEHGWGDCDHDAENGCESKLCYTSQGYECAVSSATKT